METIFEIEHESAVKESSIDLSPLQNLLRVLSPGEYARLLREVHHKYASLLIESFIEADFRQDGREINYSEQTTEDLFFLKVLADCFDEIEKNHA